MRQFMRVVQVLLVLVVLSTAASALGRPAVNDLELQILSQSADGQGVINSLSFGVEFVVATDGGEQTVTLRYALPSGLRFTVPPSETDGCVLGPPVVCRASLVRNETGTLEYRKRWSVRADAPGIYEVTGSVEGERSDPNTANNTYTVRFDVRTAGGGGGGGGGGAAAVSVSAVKLTPARPKAGSVVLATVSVRADGAPVRPSRVACAGVLAGKQVTGNGRAGAGTASCRYSTSRSAKGKTIVGSMRITATGRTITRRFAARLG